MCVRSQDVRTAKRTAAYRNYILEHADDPIDAALVLSRLVMHRAVFLSWRSKGRQVNQQVYMHEGKFHTLFWQSSYLEVRRPQKQEHHECMRIIGQYQRSSGRIDVTVTPQEIAMGTEMQYGKAVEILEMLASQKYLIQTPSRRFPHYVALVDFPSCFPELFPIEKKPERRRYDGVIESYDFPPRGEDPEKWGYRGETAKPSNWFVFRGINVTPHDIVNELGLHGPEADSVAEMLRWVRARKGKHLIKASNIIKGMMQYDPEIRKGKREDVRGVAPTPSRDGTRI